MRALPWNHSWVSHDLKARAASKWVSVMYTEDGSIWYELDGRTCRDRTGKNELRPLKESEAPSSWRSGVCRPPAWGSARAIPALSPPSKVPSSCLCSAVLCWCLSGRLTRYLDLEAHFRHFSCRQYRWPRRRRTFPALVYRALPRTTPADFSCVTGLEATSTAPLKHEPTVGSRVSPGFSLDRPAADVLRLYWLP